MGFEMKKMKHGFAPVLRCDKCRKENTADMMNFDHDWDCTKFRVVCKPCCNYYRDVDAEAWMEMNDYLVSLVHNAKVDLDSDCIEKVS
jgi:hypothetical protein